MKNCFICKMKYEYATVSIDLSSFTLSINPPISLTAVEHTALLYVSNMF